MPRFLLSNKVVVGLLLGIAALIMLVGYASSLWFLRGMWGATLAETELGYQRTVLVDTFLNGQGKVVEQELVSILSGKQDYFQRVAYLADDSGEYVALIPKLRYQLAASAHLRASGWHVSRTGWILLASRVREGASIPIRKHSVWDGVIAELKAIAYNKLPVSPLFLFRTQQEGVSPIAVYASEEAGKVAGVASIDTFEFIALDHNKKQVEKPIKDTALIVALPSSVLGVMNTEFGKAFERSIAEALHFQKTNPTLISSLPAGEDIYLIRNVADIAIGVRDRGEVFGGAIVDALNAEQGQRHPKKKAFALPDRSVGYEYVRGGADVKFKPRETTNGCLSSDGYDETLFLCGKQKAAVLASSEYIGSKLTDFMSGMSAGEWRGYVPGEYPISFAGSDKEIHFWIDQK